MYPENAQAIKNNAGKQARDIQRLEFHSDQVILHFRTWAVVSNLTLRTIKVVQVQFVEYTHMSCASVQYYTHATAGACDALCALLATLVLR